MRILIVEDSQSLQGSLKKGLEKSGFAVDAVGDGRRGLTYALREPYDVVVLDLMIPELHGLDVIRELRSAEKDTPILVLSALDGVDDRIKGLRSGADDYLVKPFSFDELLARLEALMRRRNGAPNPRIVVGDLVIDTASRRVRRGNRLIVLSAREYALLIFLAQRRGATVSRLEIEDHLYGEDNFPMSNAVPAAISVLRSRLSPEGEPDLIHTRRGLGYVLDEVAH